MRQSVNKLWGVTSPEKEKLWNTAAMKSFTFDFTSEFEWRYICTSCCSYADYSGYYFLLPDLINKLIL